MAVEFLDKEDEEKDSQGGNTLGTTSAVINPEQAAPASENSQSGNYTNLQSYLDANKGNNLSQDLSQNVIGEADAANEAAKQSETSFKSQVDQNTVKPNEDLFNQIKIDPTKVAQDKNSKESFQKMYNAQYQGPKNLSDDFADYVSAQSKQRKAEESGELTQNAEGRKTLLKNYYGRPDYTEGQQNLDQLLVQNDENADKNLSSAKARVDAQKTSFGSLKDSLNQYASQASQVTQDAYNKSRGLIEQEKGGFKSDLTNRYNQELQSRQNDYNQIQEMLKRGEITKSLADRYGLSNLAQGDKINTYGKSPLEYVSQTANPNINQFASKQEASKYQALTDLAGQQNDFLGMSDQLGTYDANKDANIDIARLQNDIGGNKSQLEALLNQKIFRMNGSTQAPNRFDGGTEAAVGGGGIVNQAAGNSQFGNTEWADSGLVEGSLQDNINYVQNNPYMQQLLTSNNPMYSGDVRAAPLKAKYGQLMTVYNNLKQKYGADTALRIING